MENNNPHPNLHFCSNCHCGVLEIHPEEKLANLGYIKCPICGFSKQLKKEIKDIHRIVYGRKSEN